MNPWLRALQDVFFPPNCVHCRGLAEEGPYRHLCARCARLLSFIGEPDGEAPAEAGPRRAERARAFGSARAAVRLEGPARSLLLELKYHAGRHVLADIGEIFRRSPALLAHVRGAILVPVPLHPRKQRERGFNQSRLLCVELARVAGAGTTVELLLRRVRDTPSQTALDRSAREANLRDAFAPAGRIPDPERRYVVMDDVLTTGATLNGCAWILRRSGCLRIDAAAYGRG